MATNDSKSDDLPSASAKEEFERIKKATCLAIERVIAKGADDVFKPPTFSRSIETEILSKQADAFREEAFRRAVRFLKAADLEKERIGVTRRALIIKDQISFRECAWLDPFDAVKYLATTYLLFEKIEAARIPKSEGVVHSHRLSDQANEIFDSNYGYDSFRAKSSELSRQRVGKWKIITDISNFFDRIGNHTLENHLLSIRCDEKYVSLIREILLLFARSRRSYGIPVGSDASRILSEAILLNVDRKLTELGIVFIRYVDDFRIFAESRAEAIKAVETLTNLLSDEGLHLNSKKTDIYQIPEYEEDELAANGVAGDEHERIDLDEKVEIRRVTRISGRTSISRFYREPGKEALKKIQAISKEKLIEDFKQADDSVLEQRLKLVMKFFVYVEQDVQLLRMLIERKITSIFYISDALAKEHNRFNSEKHQEIKDTVFSTEDWLKCAQPLQIPVLRLSGMPAFADNIFIRSIVDGHLQSDSMLFYREALELGAHSLDRPRVLKLANDTFKDAPPFVRRTIYKVVKYHTQISDDEKRPLLKNMDKQHDGDWFIPHI